MWELALLALGQASGPLLKKAAERHVERFFGDRLAELARLGKKSATVTAMQRAWTACVDLILREVLGGPGSGKSTLTRYLLLATLDPPRGEDPAWSRALRGHLPLLVELRDFIGVYGEQRCDNFLDYWHHLGRTQKYHLDQGWLDRRLRSAPSLVLFDGLDEIFDARQRERVMHAIVGFAGDFPRARVVVTSRPVGYRDAVLRAGDFRHYAIEDLDDEHGSATSFPTGRGRPSSGGSAFSRRRRRRARSARWPATRCC